MGILNTALLPLFTFFAPGFLFVIAFHGYSRLSRTYLNKGILFDAAALVFVSFVVNSAVLPFYIAISSIFFDYAKIASVANIIINQPNDLNRADFVFFFFFVVGYFFAASIIAVMLGGLCMIALEKAPKNSRREFIARRFTHYSLFPIVQGAGSPFNFEVDSRDHSQDYVMAAVMTNITYSNRVLIYYGAILDIVVSGRGDTDAITLSNPEKFLLKIKDDTAETPSRSSYVQVFDGKNWDESESEKSVKLEAQYMTIYGKIISNITFERFNFQMSVATEEDRQAVELLMSRRPT